MARRRELTADEVEDVLNEISAAASAVDENIEATSRHQSQMSDVSTQLANLAQRLREGHSP